MEEVKENSELVERLKRQIIEASDMSFVEQLINDNQIVFEMNDKKYRVRKPTFDERQKIFKERSKVFTEFLADESYPMEADLRQLYKKRGIDISKMDDRMKTIENKKQDLYLRLGKLLKDKAPDPDCKLIRDEIKELVDEQTTISVEKTNMLQYSLETNVLVHIYSYLAYIVSEYQDGEDWKRIFATVDEFKAGSGQLINKLIMLSSLMVSHELEL